MQKKSQGSAKELRRNCCIRRGPSGERILDVVSRKTEFELFGIRRGVLGRLHTLVNEHHDQSMIVHLYSNTLITILRFSADSNQLQHATAVRILPHKWIAQ
jgi:hypothetical protein